MGYTEMMENKYYTPEIEEFYVGFEFEISQFNNDEIKWEVRVWKGDSQTKFLMLDDDKNTRVKYLDREDIENLGFASMGSGWYQYRHGVLVPHWTKLRIRTWMDNEIIITGYREEEEGRLFQGVIKNKSELKKILKQIGV